MSQSTPFRVYSNCEAAPSLWSFDVWTGSSWECPSDMGCDDCSWYASKSEATEAALAYIASI